MRTIGNCSCNINKFGDYSTKPARHQKRSPRRETKLWRHEYRQSTKKKISGIFVAVDRLTQQGNQLRQEKIQQQIVITGFRANLTDSFLVDKVVLMANNVGLALKRSDVVEG
jgi:hypothetical protein